MSEIETIGLQYLVKFRSGQDYKHVQDDAGGVPVIGSGGPFTTATEHLYDGESVLFGRKGTIDRPIHINGKFWTVDTMFYTELSHHIDGRWLYYWSTTIPFGLYSTETALPSMTSSTLGRLEVPVLNLETQRRIADFLDRETGEIDAMISKLDELDETLEARSSLVLETVINELEESGWISTKYLARIQTGSGDTKDAIDNGEYPFFVRSQTPLKHHSWEFYGDAVLTAGDGVGVGKVFHLVNGKFMAHQRVYVLNEFQNVLPSYFFYIFKHLFSSDIKNSSAKSTVDSVRMRMIADLRIPVPPLEEQRRIADHLDDVTAKIDAMLAKVAELKDLLTERRAALITDVVTGRKDVA